tara:strand:- start:433 stop:843 length:411 start_codon:yes stop_codon:yes gene_type:complete
MPAKKIKKNKVSYSGYLDKGRKEWEEIEGASKETEGSSKVKVKLRRKKGDKKKPTEKDLAEKWKDKKNRKKFKQTTTGYEVGEDDKIKPESIFTNRKKVKYNKKGEETKASKRRSKKYPKGKTQFQSDYYMSDPNN